jgi:peptidyl-tRNA hydrolase
MEPIRKVKQVIVVRNDIKIPPGKLSGQVAHASNAALIKSMSYEKNDELIRRTLSYVEGSDMNIWIDGIFTKIIVECDSLSHMESLHEIAVNLGLLVSDIIVDCGLTVFKEPTATCFAIGPNFSEDIDQITKSLKLMK